MTPSALGWVDSEGDEPAVAPFVAVAGPSAPSTPVNIPNVGTPQDREDTPSLDRALAASFTSPVRKQRRVTRNDAPPDGNQQDVDAGPAAAARPATPRPPVNTGAGDDVAAEPCCGMMQRLLGDAKSAGPSSYKAADTEDLTSELIRRVRQAQCIKACEYNAEMTWSSGLV